MSSVGFLFFPIGLASLSFLFLDALTQRNAHCSTTREIRSLSHSNVSQRPVPRRYLLPFSCRHAFIYLWSQVLLTYLQDLNYHFLRGCAVGRRPRYSFSCGEEREGVSLFLLQSAAGEREQETWFEIQTDEDNDDDDDDGRLSEVFLSRRSSTSASVYRYTCCYLHNSVFCLCKAIGFITKLMIVCRRKSR